MRSLALIALLVIDMTSTLNRINASKQYFEIRNALNCADHGLRLATYKKEKNEWILFENENYSRFLKHMFKKFYT